MDSDILFVCDTGGEAGFFGAPDIADSVHAAGGCPGDYRPADYGEGVSAPCRGGCGRTVTVVNDRPLYAADLWCDHCPTPPFPR